MEIENENIVPIESDAECIKRLEAELLRTRNREKRVDRAFHMVLDQLGIHEWVVEKIQGNFDFMERMDITDLIDERVEKIQGNFDFMERMDIIDLIDERIAIDRYARSLYSKLSEEAADVENG